MARYGTSEDTELSVSATGGLRSQGFSGRGITDPFMTARVGGKYALFNQHFAILGGIGGGLSEFGSFVAPDIGVSGSGVLFGTEVFTTVRYSISVPLAASNILIEEDSREDDALHRARRTHWLEITPGARVPLSRATDAPHSALTFAMPITYHVSQPSRVIRPGLEGHGFTFGMAIGYEYVM